MFSIVFNRVGWVQKRSSQEYRGGVYTRWKKKEAKENKKLLGPGLDETYASYPLG